MYHFSDNSADLRTTELLTATLAVNTQAATVGETLVYTLTLVNKGAEPAAFDVTDTLPDNLVLVDAPGMTASGQSLTASGTLNSGAQQQFAITVRIHAYHFTVENRAIVRSGAQTQTVSAPVVRIASAAASVHYLPLIMR
ncbi:MAG TPA: hypothetical protein VFT66_13775 [Roseiflexaceae bacterium]|jgi:uncharacterized repeat protein (TIGR01451 family)|nr:hypothetical protein [Roseiflexaceae bacterium]